MFAGRNKFDRFIVRRVSAILFSLSCLFFASACLGSFRCSPDLSVNKSSAIIFVPGFKGTLLEDPNSQKRVWLTASEALFGTRSLALTSLVDRGEPELQIGSTFRKLRVLPFIYSIDIYGSFLDFVENKYSETHRVVPFVYDWRMDNHSAVVALDELVHKLRGEGVEDVTLVGHSMGGLVVSYYLRYGTQDFENPVSDWSGAKNVSKVILAGVPYRGSISMFHDMLRGLKTGRNTSLFNAEAIGSFPSSYQLLPHPEDDILLSYGGDSGSSSIFDLSLWQKCRWGLLDSAHGRNEENEPTRRDYLSLQLARAKMLFNSLTSEPSVEIASPVSTLVVVGTGRETPAKAIWQEQDCKSLAFLKIELSAERDKFSEVFNEDGDGVVTASSQSLPKAYQQGLDVSYARTSAEHGRLLANKEIWKAIEEFL